MNSDIDNREILYCADDDEYRKYCDICDEYCMERYCKIHFEPGTHPINFYERQRLNNSSK